MKPLLNITRQQNIQPWVIVSALVLACAAIAAGTREGSGIAYTLGQAAYLTAFELTLVAVACGTVLVARAVGQKPHA